MQENKNKFVSYLKVSENYMCDDCLSNLLEIQPRQVVNAVCNKLHKQSLIMRQKSECSNCKENKFVNSICDIGTDIKKVNICVQDGKTSLPTCNNDDYIYTRMSGYDFEKRVNLHLQNLYSCTFEETLMTVGCNKKHKFDLVSKDKSIVIECKSYTWTKEDNFPSAKISTAIETLLYLSRIEAKKKVIVFQDDFNKKGESLVDTFIRRYEGLFDDVEIWTYNVKNDNKNDTIIIKREKGRIWYKEMYCEDITKSEA